MPVLAKPLPDVEFLRAMFAYDQVSGALTWKVNKRGHYARIGAVATRLKRDGALLVSIGGRRQCLAHRVAWKIYYGTEPPPIIDHADGVPSNNAIKNLREADASESMFNTCANKYNTTGFKGVYFCKRVGKYEARVNFRNKTVYLGFFLTAEMANEAAVSARVALHGEFACHSLTKRAA